jgi:hypothetical protein
MKGVLGEAIQKIVRNGAPGPPWLFELWWAQTLTTGLKRATSLEIASPHFTPVVARVSRASASMNGRAAARAVTGVVPSAMSFTEAVEP